GGPGRRDGAAHRRRDPAHRVRSAAARRAEAAAAGEELSKRGARVLARGAALGCALACAFTAAGCRRPDYAEDDKSKLHVPIVDGISQLPNVASLVFREHEGSYLVGMIAAAQSKSGTIGFVGGMDVPLIHRFEVGYEEGARAMRPGVRVIPNYVGVTESAWND